MLDRIYLRERADELRKALANRGWDQSLLDDVISLDERRRVLVGEADDLRARRNELSKRVAELKKRNEDATEAIETVRKLADRLSEIERLEAEATEAFNRAWLSLPNIPHESVPVGKDAGDNRILYEWGERQSFSFQPLAHWDLGPMLGILDFESAARMSGSRFVMFRGLGSRMVRALMNFFLDVNTAEYGYTEVWPPILAREAAAVGSGHLPKFREEMYYTGDEDGLYLAPTAELPLANLHMGETLREEQLPLKYTAYTPCFRREAGSYGKDVRGMIRVHQFDKVELFRYVLPEQSDQALEEMRSEAEGLLRRLGLPYRVVELCTGDLGFAAIRTYDLEAWAPGIGRWLEVSSISNTGDFQARRSGTRLRRKDGTMAWPHTLNGSGLAFPRVIVAILENYQAQGGVVRVPDALVPYMGTDVIAP
ncbi:MAG: serine--tRNA ligase [candidate division WOR-3 bacterium]